MKSCDLEDKGWHMSREKTEPLETATLFQDESLLAFFSKKNKRRHKRVVVDYLLKQENMHELEAASFCRQLHAEFRCFVPLSTYEIKNLLFQKRLWLSNWTAEAYTNNQPPDPTQSGVWLLASQLPAGAYVQTKSLTCNTQLEVTRLAEAGWHLAYYHLSLAKAADWRVCGPAGWLTLSQAPQNDVVFMPEKPHQFLLHWARKHRKECRVEALC